jgi:CheY-like chemotaxis protein/anti-sigma regulatory factor (Ser/Thr protein kinase)
MMRPRAVEKSLQFSMEIDNGAPRYISTDPLRLRQILLNLVANAIKYTDRGSVALEVEAAPAGGGNQLSIRVVDTGCGIATDDQQEIFEAFHQVDDKSQNNAHSLNRGVGLGLAIASKLTGLLGGELRVESQPQQGSKFTLHLPAASLGDEVAELAESAAHAAYNPAATYPCRQGRILVAEDTPSIQFLLRKMLSRYATSLDIVGDGQQALEKYCAASADNQPYDLVVLDMNMPVMSGYEFARRLRSDKFATPIIALTASAMIGDRERCLEAGCTSYVAKPIDWSLLEAEVQRSLAEE